MDELVEEKQTNAATCQIGRPLHVKTMLEAFFPTCQCLLFYQVILAYAAFSPLLGASLDTLIVDYINEHHVQLWPQKPWS